MLKMYAKTNVVVNELNEMLPLLNKFYVYLDVHEEP